MYTTTILKSLFITTVAFHSLTDECVAISNEATKKSKEELLVIISKQCPKSYPEVVVALNEPNSLKKIESEKLINRLESWNPALRKQAAEELINRGDEVKSQLLAGTKSSDWKVRAGSAFALTSILKTNQLQWKKHYPTIKDGRQGAQKVSEESGLEPIFLGLAKDPQMEVRLEALKGLSALAIQSADGIIAVMEFTGEEDEYFAQTAMRALNNKFSSGALKKQDILLPYIIESMKKPLPRGKGDMMRVVTRMDEKYQRKLIPVLLDHLKWTPVRDTMFGGGGQKEALDLLVKFKEKKLIPLLPMLISKKLWGKSLIEPTSKAILVFGKDAKPILPELQQLVKDIKPSEEDLKWRPAVVADYKIFIKAVKQLQAL